LTVSCNSCFLELVFLMYNSPVQTVPIKTKTYKKQ
jgi:hypothetical protein